MTGGISATLVAVGVDAATAAAIAGTAITGAEVGGGIGFVSNLAEGKGLGQSLLGGVEGAGEGGLAAGVGGAFGPAVGGALGVGDTVGTGLVGAATQAGIAGATGGNVGISAAEGFAGGALQANSGDIMNALGGSSAGATGATTGAGAAPGAAATAAPAGVAGGGGDVTFDNSFPTGVNGASGPASGISGGSSGAPGGATLGNSLSGGTDVVAPPPTAPNVPGVTTGGLDSSASANLLSDSGSPGSSPYSNASLSNQISSVNAPSGGTAGGGSGGSGGGGSNVDTPNSIATAFQTGNGSDILNALGKNSNILLPAAGLAYNAIEGNQETKGLSNLESSAGQLANQGGQLQSYLQNGTLPPGAQGSINQATDSAIAAIKSRYAAMGASGSSAEQTEIANAQQTAATKGYTLALNLLSQGVTETQLSSELYGQIMQATLQKDQQLQNAVTNFASAATGGGGSGNSYKLVQSGS